MKLKRIVIRNFRRISEAEIILEPASFIIGPNNYGKSSVIDAIEALLSLTSEYVTEYDFRLSEAGQRSPTIEIEGVFNDISVDVAQSRGFKGRVINGEFTYKKTFHLASASKPTIESITYPYVLRPAFSNVRTVDDLLELGISQITIDSYHLKFGQGGKLPKDWENDFIEVIDYLTDQPPTYEPNPGGIPSNVVSKLPRIIRIPSLVNPSEIESTDKKKILGECLSLLFEDLLSKSTLANNIQKKLDQLETKMSPSTSGSLIKKLTEEINNTISSVFPNCGIEIEPNLQNLNEILKPKYDISLFSNVSTKINKQGTGLIRTTAFAMLRYHSKLKKEKKLETRPVLVAFEEPEIYLHPAAANLLRDTIYSLGKTDQIVCNTHSPWMIDLSQTPLSLTKMVLMPDQTISSKNYGLATSLGKLSNHDKYRIKMLQLFDDELSRVFFAERVIIVEGDTELLAIKNTLSIVSEVIRKDILSKSQVIRARGKASIISLVKYLQDLDIHPIVMHDRDQGIKGAVKFNKPISDVVNDPLRLILNEENVEDSLGYKAPTTDKPFKAYEVTRKWKKISDIPATWKERFEFIFDVNIGE